MMAPDSTDPAGVVPPNLQRAKAQERPKEVQHDEAPSIVDDHPFEPKGEWWSLCAYPGCNLSAAAHKETTVPYRYVSDDAPEED